MPWLPGVRAFARSRLDSHRTGKGTNIPWVRSPLGGLERRAGQWRGTQRGRCSPSVHSGPQAQAVPAPHPTRSPSSRHCRLGTLGPSHITALSHLLTPTTFLLKRLALSIKGPPRVSRYTLLWNQSALEPAGDQVVALPPPPSPGGLGPAPTRSTQ